MARLTTEKPWFRRLEMVVWAVLACVTFASAYSCLADKTLNPFAR